MVGGGCVGDLLGVVGPRDRVTVSSDGGGWLPVFNADGEVVSMEVRDCSALMATMGEHATRGHALEIVLPSFTSLVASLLRLPGTGVLELGSRSDRLSSGHLLG